MTPRAGALLVALLVATLTPYPSSPASASCVAPTLAVAGTPEEPPVLTVGAPVRVTGRGFVEGCDDTGVGGGFGCSEAAEEEVPYLDVVLELRQAGRVWVLGRTDAGTAAQGRLGRTRWDVVVPPDVRPGRARLVAEPGEALRVTIAP